MALEDELSCPICTDVFREPVLLSCGHSFCRDCIGDHWTSSSSRNCPVCRQVSPQPPVSNLCLRNTCESYLREQSTRTERSGDEHECPTHGEKIELFCQTDEQVLCSECKKLHRGHKTQPLQQAVRLRKEKLKAALRPTEKTLWTLQNSSAQDDKVYNHNKTQIQQTGRRIREEFKKLHQFLRKEEESRIAALNEEEKEKREKMERRMKGRIRSLTDRLKEVQEGMKDDDITFLQNYNGILNRAKHTPSDQELSSEALIDVSEHLGNLKYQVWENMKEICPYYPVILNPNTELCVSDDLTSVTSSQASAPPLHRRHVVLGTVGYGINTHTWVIEVGKSRHWSLGVCFRSEGKSSTLPLNPSNGFWGLRRDGFFYTFLSAPLRFQIKTNPEAVRVRLEDLMGRGIWQRKVSFFDARNDSSIAMITGLPLGENLYPFVIPEDQSNPLRVAPVPAIITLADEEESAEMSEMKKRNVLIYALLCVLIVIVLIQFWWIFRQDK